MAAFSTQALDTLAGGLTFTASSASDTCEAPTTAGQMFLVFKGGAGTNTITIAPTQTTQYGRTLPAAGTGGTYTLNATQSVTLFIPLYPEFGTNGTITILNNASGSVTMAVVRF